MMLLPTAAIICSVVTTGLVNAFEMRVESMKPAQDSEDTKQHCLVFEDHFNRLDLSKWQHEITMSGGTFLPLCYITMLLICYLQVAIGNSSGM